MGAMGAFGPPLPQGQQGQQGQYIDWNQLYEQVNHPNTSLASGVNNFLYNGYGNYGNQLNGVMGQFADVNNRNQQASLLNSRMAADIEVAKNAGIGAEHERRLGATERLAQMSPLLEKLFGSMGGIFGGGGGGPLGFRGVDAKGNPFVSATFGSGARPTDTSRYSRPEQQIG